MYKLFCRVILLCLVFGLSGVGFAASIDQFIAPVDGGPTVVVNVVVEGQDGIVEAQTAQDGFNYASQNIRPLKGGFREVLFGSGFGYVAGSAEYYEVFDNPNATQQSLRLAYVRAFTKAKAELTRGLKGVSGRGLEILLEQLSDVTTAMESAYNISTQYGEDLAQVVEGLLRGYVVYEVEHSPERQEVYVSIVTTPKTLAAVSHASGAVLRCSSINNGIDYVMREISYGIIPPVGGKVISVPVTGETAVISFGSDIIREHENPTVVRTLLQASERAATIRANDAMIGMIEGDQVIWLSGLRSTTEYSQTEFKAILDENANVHYEVLDEVKNEFLNTMQLTDDYATFRSGHMPPGVASQVYSDGYWVYVVNVYLPASSGRAGDFYDQMQKAVPNEQSRRMDPNYQPGGNSPLQKGPSGRVSSPDDL